MSDLSERPKKRSTPYHADKIPGLHPLLVVMLGLCFVFLSSVVLFHVRVASMASNPQNTFAESKRIRHPMGLKAVGYREDLGSLLTEMGFRRGAEVGVQRGLNAISILEKWTICEYFALIDLWAHQDNYIDGANVDKDVQLSYMAEAKANISTFESRTQIEFFKMHSLDAAVKFDDDSFDFIYIDARHDYCGVTDDLAAYWPKLREGGILAGHDYLYAIEMPWSNWSVCRDGSVHPGSVRGAVEELSVHFGLTVSVMYKEERFFSWMVQKPWK